MRTRLRAGQGADGRDTRALMRLYEPVVDQEWYAQRYPDVAEAGVNPLEHFVSSGELEGRDPCGFFSTYWVAEQQRLSLSDGERPLEKFLRTEPSTLFRPLPCIDPEFIVSENPEIRDAAEVLVALSEGERVVRSSSWFDRDRYRSAYPDLASTQHLEAHFLVNGIAEGRRPGPGVQVFSVEEFYRRALDDARILDEFSWAGVTHVVVHTGIAPTVIDEILEQAAIDSRVVAVGKDSLQNLRTFRADDIASRDLIGFEPLSTLAAGEFDAVLIVPTLGVGGGEKYVVQLAETLSTRLGLATLILTTESSEQANWDAARYRWKRELRTVTVVSIRDLISATWKQETVLALLLSAMDPQVVFISNAELGFSTVEQYSKSLRSRSTLVAMFFSESPMAIGAPYSVRYSDALAGSCVFLSDNSTVFESIESRLVESSLTHRTLPQYLDRPVASRLSADTAIRRARWRSERLRRVLWVSRWEDFKNTDVLIRVAMQNPSIEFSAFGPGTESNIKVLPRNLKLAPPIWSLETFSLAEYDAFLFTSAFEGMPNIVLEMVSRNVPVVTPRVGGLPETFGPDSLYWYDNGRTTSETAAGASAALLGLLGADFSEVQAHVELAAAELWERHDRERFAQELESLWQEWKRP